MKRLPLLPFSVTTVVVLALAASVGGADVLASEKPVRRLQDKPNIVLIKAYQAGE